MSFSQEQCCVCLENKNFYTECKNCNDGKYCKKCIVKLIEENKHATCCICRQETWYKDTDKDTSRTTKTLYGFIRYYTV